MWTVNQIVRRVRERLFPDDAQYMDISSPYCNIADIDLKEE